jgi:2-polyprenyl-6-hydroxyphenyl methylase/3-demethylubiquinone-9 3-methyltransferase
MSNIDLAEVKKFDNHADSWWNEDGDLKTLHQINPLRLSFIESFVSLKNKTVLDVGCGGGILSEALAKAGASTTGIDLSEPTLDIAKNHAKNNNLTIDYQAITAEDFAQKHPNHFDVITCMEMLEHVPEPESIVKACAHMLKPNGFIFFSTINRNPLAYAHAILGAEYILKLLPKGTHEYSKFIRPSELAGWAREYNLSLIKMRGIDYHLGNKSYALSDDIKVNYLMCCQKEA